MRKLLRAVLILVILLNLLALAPLAAAAGDTVVFTDPVLEQMVRKQMGIPQGGITVQQAEQVTELDLHHDDSAPLPDDQLIQDIGSLKPFRNLSILRLYYNLVSDISVIANMENMKYLDLGSNQIADISPLAGLPLVELNVGYNRIEDFSPLAGIGSLENLFIRGNATTDYTPLEGIIDNLRTRDFDIAYTPFGREEVIRFDDPVLEQKIRQAMNMPNGDITAGDAATLDWLEASAAPDAADDERIHNISALRFFVNLSGLKLDHNRIDDLSPLQGLTNLRELWLLDNPTGGLNDLAGMTKLIRLGIAAGTEDFSFLRNMPELEELRIDSLYELPNELLLLPRLTTFCSPNGWLTDISLLAQIPGLSAVDLSWNNIADLTPLSGLPLNELYLAGNPIEDYSPIAAVYPNLVGRNFEYVALMEAENPDAVITFPDPVLERKIRQAIGKPEGDITAGDAAQVTDLRLDNDWQPQIPRDTQITDLTGLEAFINLTKLDATFNAISDLRPLAGLAQLRKLNLGGNAISDLQALAGLTGLEELTVFGSSIQDISPLSGLHALRFLNLGGNPVREIGALAGLTQLDSLYLGNCGLTDISALSGLTNLFLLDLTDNFITDLSPLSGMENLGILRLNNNPIADYAPIEAIYPNLQEKDFEYGQHYDVDIPLKPEQPDAEVIVGDDALEAILRQVTGVHNGPLTQQNLADIGKLLVEDGAMWQNVRDLSALRYCLNLAGLVIEASQVSDLSPLHHLSKLRGIRIVDSRISDLSPLEGLQSLNMLELHGNQIADITVLQSLPNLTRIELSANQIEDFSPLYSLPNLTALQIQRNAATDVTGLKDLASRLTEKDFDPDQPLESSQPNEGGDEERQPEATAEPAMVIQFPDPAMELKMRKALDRPEGEITTADAAGLENLWLNNEWQEAYEEGSQITDLTGIEYFTDLRSLDISWNLITSLEPLAGLQHLEYLRMYGNQVSDLTPLAGKTTLYNLNLGGNLITDITPLKTLTNLGELYLSDNPIADFSPVKAIYPQLQQTDFTLE